MGEEEEEEQEAGFKDNLKTAGGAVAFLVAFIGSGAYFFSVFEEDLSFFNAFYFTFITMLTIGFGDIVPDIVGGENLSPSIVSVQSLLYFKKQQNSRFCAN